MGTAPSPYERYLLLEYAGVWPQKAWAGAEVPDEVRAHVDAAVGAVPGVRLQLVRQHRQVDCGPRLFLADTRAGRLTTRALDGYDELLRLPLSDDVAAGVLSGGDDVPALWMTCTHSRRDRCCAKWGLPVQAALRERVGAAAWQASHVGGHRFAPNVLLLPHGIMLGRVSPADVEEIAAAVDAGRLPPLRFWRGRTCLAPHQQAAEIVARGDSGLDPGVPKVVSDELESGVHTVGLQFGSASATVSVAARPLPAFAKSCGEEPSGLRGWATVS